MDDQVGLLDISFLCSRYCQMKKLQFFEYDNIHMFLTDGNGAKMKLK